MMCRNSETYSALVDGLIRLETAIETLAFYHQSQTAEDRLVHLTQSAKSIQQVTQYAFSTLNGADSPIILAITEHWSSIISIATND